MLGMMKGERIYVVSDDGINADDIIDHGVRGKNDVHAMASKNGNSIWVMVWNYHDDNVPGTPSTIELLVNDIGSKKVLVQHYRVDEQFSNSFEKWKSLGRLQEVTGDQYSELELAGQLQLYHSPQWIDSENGKAVLNFNLPRQGVSLIQLTW
jgi:xylan 1,4-beta-xylosidase